MDPKQILPELVKTIESHEKNLQRASEQISFLNASVTGVLQQIRMTKEQVQHLIDNPPDNPSDDLPADPSNSS